MRRSPSTDRRSRAVRGAEHGAHIDDFIAFRVSVLAHLMGRIVGLTYGRLYGISLRQWRVLAFVGRSGTLSAKEVARRSPLDKSQVSRAVTELAERGLLRSDHARDDRRKKLLVLTPSGLRLYQQLLSLGRERNARYAGALTGAERVVFDRALKKITVFATPATQAQPKRSLGDGRRRRPAQRPRWALAHRGRVAPPSGGRPGLVAAGGHGDQGGPGRGRIRAVGDGWSRTSERYRETVARSTWRSLRGEGAGSRSAHSSSRPSGTVMSRFVRRGPERRISTAR